MDAPQKDRHPAAVLAGPLTFVTQSVLRAPGAVLALGLVLAAASLVLAGGWLGFHTNRLDLLNPNSEFNRRWLAYLDEFGNQDDVVIVVEGPAREQVVAAIDDLAAALENDRAFRAVLHRTDLSALQAKALHHLSVADLRRLHGLLDHWQSILHNDWNQLSAMQLLRQEVLARRDQGGADHLLAILDGGTTAPSWASAFAPLQELERRLEPAYFLFEDDRLGVVLLHLAPASGVSAGTADAIRLLRQRIQGVQERHALVQFGVTGMPVLEHDEMATSQRDSSRASLWSLVGVACVFAAGFGGLRRPLLAVAALLLGIAWSLGYITLTVGHVNILSVAFGVILIGLGIDFGIHYLARYGHLRDQGVEVRAALLDTARHVGPGIVTGGLTTALAFFATGLTEFTGVAELGVIAGGGVLLCVLAGLMMLPAMLILSERGPTTWRTNRMLPMAALCRPASHWPRLTLLVTIGVTAGLAWGLTRLRYDHNLLNLQPRRQESVAIARRLATHTDRSGWFAVSMHRTRHELLERKRQFESLSIVKATEEIASLLPEPDAERQNLIAQLQDRLAQLPEHPPLLPVVDQQTLLSGVEQALARPASADDRWRSVLTRLEQLSAHEYFEHISRWQQTSARQLLDALHRLRAMSDPTAPQAADLPPALAQRYIGRSGGHLLRVYGSPDIWDMASLEPFVRGLEAVDPRITGHPVQTFYASRQMQQGYLHAAVYAFLAVLIVLMLDFRSLGHALLAMSPMVLGLVQLLGLLGWLGIPLNPANMIVLPLILGIGVDDGVHIVHDAVRSGSPYQISHSTAAAIFLTSVTTMIGFGSLMLAAHQGLQSLGRVLTLGVFSCLFSSVLVLPALLALRRLLSP